MDEDKTHRPKWLRKLERESWQAELIISGAALLGSLQLPGLLDKFQYYLLLNFERASLPLWFFATSYWALFVYGLVILFVFHFIVRALWIGLVGLNSVYPDGIVETPLASKDYQQKVIAEYGDIDGFINRLDQMASGMFGTGFTFIGLFFNLGLFMSVAILLLTFLQKMGVSDFWAWSIGLAPVVLTFTASALSSVLSLPKFRDRAWVKRYHFPLAKLIGRLSYPVNTRYTVTGLMLVSSHGTPKDKPLQAILKSIGVAFAGSLILGIFMGMSDAIKPQFLDNHYHRMGDDETGMDRANYADTDFAGVLYEPLLSAQYPHPTGPLWVWVPLPERELSIMLDACSQPEVADELSREEARKAKRKRLVSCTGEYIEVYLDDQPIKLPQALREYRSTKAFANQFGVRLNLSHLAPAPGHHTLKVVTHYPLDEEPANEYRTTYIPFFVIPAAHTPPGSNDPAQ